MNSLSNDAALAGNVFAIQRYFPHDGPGSVLRFSVRGVTTPNRSRFHRKYPIERMFVFPAELALTFAYPVATV